MVGILKDEDGYQCCIVQPQGLPRKDGRPYKVIATYISVVNEKPEVIVKNDLINDKDIVLFYNTAYTKPDFNIYWLAKMLGETDLSIYKNIIYARYAPLLKGKSEREKVQLTEAIDKIIEGEISVFIPEDIIEDRLAGGDPNLVVNITDVTNSDKIQYLSHLYQDFIKRFSMDYGCPISGVEKMAQQNNAEINGDVAYSWLLPIDMLNQAKEGCKRAKELWPELEIDAHFGTLHELMYLKFAQDITKDNPDMNVSIEENQNIEDLEVADLFNNEETLKEDPAGAEDITEETEETTEEEKTEESPVLEEIKEDLEEIKEELEEIKEEDNDNEDSE